MLFSPNRPKRHLVPLGLVFNWYRDPFPRRYSGKGRLTSDHNLVPESRMSWAISLRH